MFTERTEGHLRLYRGGGGGGEGGDEETLPEWLRERGLAGPPGYITIHFDSVDPESQMSQLANCADFFVLRISVS